MRIELLSSCEQFIPVVARWYLSVFGRKGTTIEKCENALKQRLNTEALDCCFLAFVDDELVGTVSLTKNDIPDRPHLSPCITQLVVLEKYRHQGIGTALVSHALKKLKEMKFDSAYLYTTNPTIHKWYEKMGWRVIESGSTAGIEIKIMEHSL